VQFDKKPEYENERFVYLVIGMPMKARTIGRRRFALEHQEMLTAHAHREIGK
jgi:hypothetical protein